MKSMMTSLHVGMDSHIHIHIPLFLTSIVTISFFFLTILPQSHCEEQDTKYTECSKPYSCGNVSNIYYPFWGDNRPHYCGASSDLFELHCQANQTTSIQTDSQNFTVLEIHTYPYDYTMKMVRTGIAYDDCSSDLTNTSLNTSIFQYTEGVRNITIFYDCPSGTSIGGYNFSCQHDNNRDAFFVEEKETPREHLAMLQRCSRRIQVQALQGVPLDPYGGIDALERVLGGGFEVRYIIEDAPDCKRCLESNGTCGRDDDTAKHHFSCHCPDGSHAVDCLDHKRNQRIRWERKVIIGVTGAAIAGLLICITIFCFRCKSSTRQGKFWLPTKSNQDIEAFLKNHGALSLKRYKFSDVKKMTNSFKVKLGQGGFGAVYKGKLLSGCPVAVKILNASKENGEEFINEVASISRTSHINVVTLLGFCLEGRKKALIYEFMLNGSLEKFIFNKGPETAPSLSWEKLYQIAKGIARGLEYLHRGCNTRILHFDIKPHNILLDENFCPKISDFGLAKLCPRKESIISMSDARGTMGYVAPEVWNRHFGGVSHKSDVYSYGMMLLEMVGGRKNINAEASHTSEIYFPHWVYRRLELGNNLGLDGVVTAEENETAKRMTLVGLWCVQTFPNDRPTMSRVIEMLEGSMNSLEMPPKPVLSSPTRSVAESSTTLN